MSTAVKSKAEKVAVKDKSIHDVVQDTFAASADLREAIEKLNDLKSKLSVLVAERDQLNAAAETDVEELAQRILEGDDLGDREQLFAKRAALTQRIEAFEVAIREQQKQVNLARQMASDFVLDAVNPMYQVRLKRVLSSIRELDKAHTDLQEVQQTLTRNSVSVGHLRFDGLVRLGATLPALRYFAGQFPGQSE